VKPEITSAFFAEVLYSLKQFLFVQISNQINEKIELFSVPFISFDNLMFKTSNYTLTSDKTDSPINIKIQLIGNKSNYN